MGAKESLKEIYDIEFGNPQLRELNMKLLRTLSFFAVSAWFIRNHGNLLEFPLN